VANSHEREQIDCDVAIVGAGPAGLACAIHLADLIKKGNEQPDSPNLNSENIFVLEKASSIGNHTLSGAIMDPRGLQALFPNYDQLNVPLDSSVQDERLILLGQKNHFPFPFIPKALRNTGNHIISLGRLVAWLGEQAEQRDINLLTGFAAQHLLIDNQQVIGVISDDKGLDKQGEQKPNFEPGIELRAKVTALAEGTRGSLTKKLISKFNLDEGCNPPAYGLGVKELWEIPDGQIKPGSVWHTAGYPLANRTTGGGWIYAMQNNRLSLGLVSGLHFADPRFDPHQALQQFKCHPFVSRLLKGGKFLHYGAKTLSQGGYWSLPKPFVNGAMILGDGAGLVDSQRLKGIHLAIYSGMLAAQTTYNALCTQDYSELSLKPYQDNMVQSWIGQDLWAARNYHQAMQRGFWHILAQQLSGGRSFFRRYKDKSAHLHFNQIPNHSENSIVPFSADKNKADEEVSFNKTTSVYHSGTQHEVDQPVHIQLTEPDICHTKCKEEFGNPCLYFCPGSVFEMLPSGDSYALKINAANCLHCKACDILDPYQIINWQTPEGGGGPQYESM
jgi:electron-transferring-flavoprotein dehydrogenase